MRLDLRRQGLRRAVFEGRRFKGGVSGTVFQGWRFKGSVSRAAFQGPCFKECVQGAGFALRDVGVTGLGDMQKKMLSAVFLGPVKPG